MCQISEKNSHMELKIMSETLQKRGPLNVGKSAISVVIFTQFHRIEGRIHAIPGARLTDLMNANPQQTFLPVTEAKVFPLSGESPLYTQEFLSVNRNFITLVIPQTTPEEPL